MSLAAEALDFAPDLLAIQERPPSRLPRVLLWLVATLVGALLLWASLAQLDIVAVAEGRLVPLTFTKVVQPAEAGIVADILVKDGDTVRAGQVLMRLDSRMSRADTDALSNEVALRRATLRRIEAELTDRPFVAAKNEAGVFHAQVEAQFRARRQAFIDALAQETESLNKARADLLAAQQVHDKLTQTLPSYRQSAEAYRKLKLEGFVGELPAAEKAREAIEKEQDLRAQAAAVVSLQASIAHGEKRIASLRSQYRSQLENERVDTLAQMNRSGQELEKSTIRAGLLDVRAPTSGIVKDLVTTTTGAVVAAGALLMHIVPHDEPLQAEVSLKNEDIGFVAIGQPVKIKVAAYPFQKYGLLDGTVALVSADAADPRHQPPGQPPQPSYRAIVRLDSPRLVSAAAGASLPLNAGMLVICEIHQGRRSVLEYLLSPVQKVGQEAGRER